MTRQHLKEARLDIPTQLSSRPAKQVRRFIQG